MAHSKMRGRGLRPRAADVLIIRDDFLAGAGAVNVGPTVERSGGDRWSVATCSALGQTSLQLARIAPLGDFLVTAARAEGVHQHGPVGRDPPPRPGGRRE